MTAPTSTPCPADPDTVRAWLDANRADPAAVRAWAAPRLAAADRYGPVPSLGGPAWQALPDTDPRKLAAVVLAALARLDENTPAAITDRLHREMTEIHRLVMDRIRHASWDVAAAWSQLHRDRHGELRIPPSHTELARRRSTFPCLSCHTADVVHPQTVCTACQQPDTAHTTAHTTDAMEVAA